MKSKETKIMSLESLIELIKQLQNPNSWIGLLLLLGIIYLLKK
jgi:hypothetical protein